MLDPRLPYRVRAVRAWVRLAMACALIGAVAAAAQAATFVVNSTGDAEDAIPGNGVCADRAGRCTLRAAVEEANARPGADVVMLPAGAYTLTAGQIRITDTLTFSGSGAFDSIISGSAIGRIFIIPGPFHVVISGVTIQKGFDANGAGVFNAGILELTDVNLSRNHTDGFGGGLFNLGNAVLRNVTIDRNSASVGAGAANYGPAAALTLTNTTVSSNRAGFEGGALFTYRGTVTLTNVTHHHNRVRRGDGLANYGGTITLANSILNRTSCGGPDGVDSLGHNIDSGTTCDLQGPGDLSHITPKLAPLRNNGGPTKTHALLTGSPAIDAGDAGRCPSTDQRGAHRPADGDHNGSAICDIGAYEQQP
jgi:CSLREA domain-containing protein